MEEKRFTLRMDGELFEEISQLAKENRRSVAKEIEYAVSLYVLELKQAALLNSADPSTTSEEEARSILKQMNELNKKYKRNFTS